jgi:hypothetical protein
LPPTSSASTRSIQVRRGEADAKLIVRWFALHGRPEQVEAAEIDNKWIVRITE